MPATQTNRRETLSSSRAMLSDMPQQIRANDTMRHGRESINVVPEDLWTLRI